MKNKGNIVLHTLSTGKIGLKGENRIPIKSNEIEFIHKRDFKGPYQLRGVVEYGYICSFNLIQII